MSGSMWLMIVVVLLAGGVGGSANAMMTENGFLFPRWEPTANGGKIYRPGFIGNVFMGAIAALVSWGLYGPLSAFVVAGTQAAVQVNPDADRVGLTLAGLVGAVLVGVGGARWLSNEVDKNLLKAAAVAAADKSPSAEASKRIAQSSPAQALEIARSL